MERLVQLDQKLSRKQLTISLAVSAFWELSRSLLVPLETSKLHCAVKAC